MIQVTSQQSNNVEIIKMDCHLKGKIYVNEIRSRKTLIFRIKNCDDDFGILDEIGLVYLVIISPNNEELLIVTAATPI
jgi:hypothetical protein